MHPRRILVTLVAGLLAQPVIADDNESLNDNYRNRSGHGNHTELANAAFGRGLNTAQPGNAVNHAVLPSYISVKEGGVVDFAVAGFHDIIIFKPGLNKHELDALLDAGTLPLAGLFIVPRDPGEALPDGFGYLADKIYYRGINPAGGPPPGRPEDSSNPSNGSNRAEPVTFLEPGKYFVICNVLPHYNDGMFAWVEVKGDHH